MSNFQIGDAVLCINADDADALLTKGKVYIIREATPTGVLVNLLADDGTPLWAGSGRFVLDEFPSGTYEAPVSDAVRQPHHYARHVIEPITYINANKLPYNVGNAIKYLSRFDAKDGRQDLKKAIRYCEIQLECMDREDRVAAGEDPKAVWAVML